MRKTKKFAAILLSALILSSSFSVLPVSAATIESNNQAVSLEQVIKTKDFMYSILDNENIKIEKYIGNDKTVVIPDTIEDKSVKSIGEDAFSNCSNIEKITIPDSVNKIDDYAFCGCSSLNDISIPNSVYNLSLIHI